MGKQHSICFPLCNEKCSTSLFILSISSFFSLFFSLFLVEKKIHFPVLPVVWEPRLLSLTCCQIHKRAECVGRSLIAVWVV